MNMKLKSVNYEKWQKIGSKIKKKFKGSFTVIHSLNTNYIPDPSKELIFKSLDWSHLNLRITFCLKICKAFDLGSQLAPFSDIKYSQSLTTSQLYCLSLFELFVTGWVLKSSIHLSISQKIGKEQGVRDNEF
jgi:hypothetical protein